ncbi:hypothetical protein AB0G74_16640 [Streptomyces sp. NPDC020875]|uniref:hypothetical protein n=1 Tax=Streptomyces sp. NPDC020875 TaxID=3154898 RepID=UPI0033DACBF2
MLPVYTSHDEYLFIRVLQMFEVTFALMASQIKIAILRLTRSEAERATEAILLAERSLSESAPLFSLLVTMQVESFRTFRDFTEGASAIQSQNYKLMESLCCSPSEERRDSPAYYSVPDIRQRILEGQVSLDDAYGRFAAQACPDANSRHLVMDALELFASTMRRWRNTHYRLAVRMLGDRSGTGYTEGTPYLREVREVPVFRKVSGTPEGRAHD